MLSSNRSDLASLTLIIVTVVVLVTTLGRPALTHIFAAHDDEDRDESCEAAHNRTNYAAHIW